MTNLDRVNNLRTQLKARELDAVLLTNLVNIGYVSGFTGSTAYLVVTASEAVLITDPRYTLRAKEECPDFETFVAQGSGGYPEALKAVIERGAGIQKLGFEAGHVTVSFYERLRKDLPESLTWTATDGLVEDLRLIKDAGEVAATEEAVRVAQESFLEIKPLIKPGVTEREIGLILEHAMRLKGAEAPAFDTIVASGPNGARPHHTPSGRKLEAGDLVTIDWGAKVGGYCSDITRTIAVGAPGALSGEGRRIYDVVNEARVAAIAAMGPGKNGQEIDAVARDYIASHGYGDAFSHSLGHSLGRVVHDGPGLSTRSEKLILKPGMIMTVEPGIYLENVGGVRIEDDVLITEDGARILTSLPRDLEFLG
jgi:Xaa-Pro aminopeptidase